MEKTLSDYIYEVLKKADGPLDYKDITKRVLKIKKITHKRPEASILAQLCRKSIFKKVKSKQRIGGGKYYI